MQVIVLSAVLVTAAQAQPGQRQTNPQQPGSATRCTETDSAPRPARPFNVERAYPQRAISQEIEGRVVYRLEIDETGAVTGITIVSAEPPGVFEDAVQREVGRMRFTPARVNCQNVASQLEQSVRFFLR